jgi:hypothetical protein
MDASLTGWTQTASGLSFPTSLARDDSGSGEHAPEGVLSASGRMEVPRRCWRGYANL